MSFHSKLNSCINTADQNYVTQCIKSIKILTLNQLTYSLRAIAMILMSLILFFVHCALFKYCCFVKKKSKIHFLTFSFFF